MFKLVPKIFFLFNLICFFVVVNILTYKKENSEVFTEDGNNIIEDQTKTQIEIRNTSKLNEVLLNDLEQSQKTKKDNMKIKQETNIALKKEIEIVESGKIIHNNSDLTKRYYTQFGAFNKKKGADSLSIKVRKILQNNYDVSELKVSFNEKNKVFRLILENSSLEIAQDICSFSKKNNIECYVTKK